MSVHMYSTCQYICTVHVSTYVLTYVPYICTVHMSVHTRMYSTCQHICTVHMSVHTRMYSTCQYICTVGYVKQKLQLLLQGHVASADGGQMDRPHRSLTPAQAPVASRNIHTLLLRTYLCLNDNFTFNYFWNVRHEHP
jgi:hypothetical protein